MFWKKGKTEEVREEQGENVSVSTIPKEFYGGLSPIIKFKTVEKNVASERISAPIMPPAEQPKAVGLFSSRKFVFLVAGGLFLILIIGSAGWYYWQMTREQEQEPFNPVNNRPDINIPVVNTEIPTTTEQTNEVATTTIPETPEVKPPSLGNPTLEFPSILLGSGEDLDRDKVSDAEEELFTTDPAKPDTDEDSYDDYTEIYHLYSPTIDAPTKIIESSVVKEYINPRFGYKLYYPASWAVGNVDSEYREVLFSTITGDNIEVRVFDRKNNESFENWFSENAPKERMGSLIDFHTVFDRSGLERSDNLVYYFTDPEYFFVIVYHVTNSEVVNYKNVITMMARSFRSENELGNVPEQNISSSRSGGRN